MTVTLPRGVEHEEGTFVIVTTEGPFFVGVTDLDHEVDQILDRENSNADDRVLRVNGFNEGPKLIDQLTIMRVHPKVGCEHQI